MRWTCVFMDVKVSMQRAGLAASDKETHISPL